MLKSTEYIIEVNERLEDLVVYVNKKMTAGWQPQGGPFMIQHSKGVQLISGKVVQAVVAQAMVR